MSFLWQPTVLDSGVPVYLLQVVTVSIFINVMYEIAEKECAQSAKKAFNGLKKKIFKAISYRIIPKERAT